MQDGLRQENISSVDGNFSDDITVGDDIILTDAISGTGADFYGSSSTVTTSNFTTASGTNIYVKTKIQGDVLQSDASISGVNINLTGTGAIPVISSTTVAATTGNLTTTSGTNVYAKTNLYVGGRQASSIGAGSPTTWGYLTQAGSTATGAGSNAWIAYGTAFGAAPVSIVAMEASTQGEWVFAPAGSWTAGSFYVETQSASKPVSWIAVGAAA